MEFSRTERSIFFYPCRCGKIQSLSQILTGGTGYFYCRGGWGWGRPYSGRPRVPAAPTDDTVGAPGNLSRPYSWGWSVGAAQSPAAPAVPICHFSKFQIWKIQILSNDKMTKIKVVDINELNNFGIDHFLCWKHFGSQILVRTCHFLNFKFERFKFCQMTRWPK